VKYLVLLLEQVDLRMDMDARCTTSQRDSLSQNTTGIVISEDEAGRDDTTLAGGGRAPIRDNGQKTYSLMVEKTPKTQAPCKARTSCNEQPASASLDQFSRQEQVE
jgi:hypothetical protein